MRIVIAGGHGQIAQRLGRLLTSRGDHVVGIVRNPDHVGELAALGVEAVVLDMEAASVEDVAYLTRGADAVVFAAGAGPGSGAARKDTVDRAASALLADAAQLSGVERFVQVSSTGVEAFRDGTEPEEVDEGFAAYLRAKLAAEDDLRARDGLHWTIVRPGRLTDEAGTGRVRLGASVERGDVPRDDVAAVLVALLDEPRTAGTVLELMAGDEPVADAVTRIANGAA